LEVSTAPVRLHGRGQEQQRIDLLLGAARSRRSGALVLRGEVGAGKSSLLAYALTKAADLRVLRCQADRAESDLPFAALHQLLGHVLPLADQLPERLRAPLAYALGLGDGAGEPDRLLVSTAVLALLTKAAQERPLLCLVDDAQWLDAGSADALSFVARRLHREGIVLLVAVRDGEGRAFEAAGVAQTALHDLDTRAATALLIERAGPEMVPEVAQLIVQRTGGLPLALVDSALTLTGAQLGGRAPLPDPLPLSARLRDAFLGRIRRLPGPTQRLLLLVAAAGVERLHVIVGAAAELDIQVSALENAEAAGVIRIDQGLVRFGDRLVHQAVYSDATFFLRRAAHLALARALGEDDDERHAWHMAAAALTRDESLAAELERSADRAAGRSDLPGQAAAMQRAAELTPDGPERGRRLTAAAGACWLSGRSVQAGELLSRADRLRPGPLLRADIAELRSAIDLGDYDLEGAHETLANGARTAAELSPSRASDLLLLAGEVAVAGSDAASAGCLARSAEALRNGRARGAAELLRGVERVLGGHFEDAAPVAERAISMAQGSNGRARHLLGLATGLSPGNDLAADAVASALDLLAAEVGRLRAAGAVGALPGALASLAWVEFWADRHRSCLANASDALSRARGLGQRWVERSAAMTLAMLAAVRGREAECPALVELLLHPPGVQSAAPHAGAATWAAALSHLGAGRFAESLSRLDELAPGRPLGQPWHALWSRPDAVEAAVRTGQSGAARAALEVLEGAARPAWPPPATALLARCRALLADGREAERHYLEALTLHEEDERPFQHARTRLLWAEHLRRNRRRVDAREQLRSALEAFERLDALPWAARARAELRATGETLRRGPADGDDLTPQEIRIAYLVAQGGSNREVAEQLFLSPRTVGYHLAKIYRKLGVSSRTRLAHLLLEDEVEEQDEPRPRGRTGLAGRAKAAFRRLGLPTQ
jgi:DNA-binding CsgD family transcriptional regulator